MERIWHDDQIHEACRRGGLQRVDSWEEVCTDSIMHTSCLWAVDSVECLPPLAGETPSPFWEQHRRGATLNGGPGRVRCCSSCSW